MIEISLLYVGSAFLAGVLMFFAPCTFPLVPAFLAYISGKKTSTRTPALVHNALLFCIGFSTIFILLGFISGLVGASLAQFQSVLTFVVGGLILLLGLHMLEVIPLEWFKSGGGFPLPHFITPGTPFGSLAVGVIFAFGWSPCVGPLMASLLLLVATEGSALTGAFLLLIFSIGMSLPFLVTAFYFKQIQDLISRRQIVAKWGNRLGGILLVSLGILLMIGGQALLFRFGEYVFYGLQLDFLLRFF